MESHTYDTCVTPCYSFSSRMLFDHCNCIQQNRTFSNSIELIKLLKLSQTVRLVRLLKKFCESSTVFNYYRTQSNQSRDWVWLIKRSIWFVIVTSGIDYHAILETVPSYWFNLVHAFCLGYIRRRGILLRGYNSRSIIMLDGVVTHYLLGSLPVRDTKHCLEGVAFRMEVTL